MKQALLSVTDKTGLVAFAAAIAPYYRILSTGGTYQTLIEAGIPAEKVEDITGVDELFDGRVKTLHPIIHGGILYKRDNKQHQIQANQNLIMSIDLVVVNLYRFSETKNNTDDEDTITEAIDIGGPALLRSAAKNHQHVSVLSDPDDYELFVSMMGPDGDVPEPFKKQLAAKAFLSTAEYDMEIVSYFYEEPFPKKLHLKGDLKEVLRYGENPHQKAAFYETKQTTYSMASAKQRHGKPLSYNNILDGDAALGLILEFEQPTAVAIKHTNPCGVAQADTIEEAYEKAYQADPVSIFGGIVALNRPVSFALAEKLNELFLEVILAPDYDEDALTLLKKKKNLRVLSYLTGPHTQEAHLRSVTGGVLVQTKDDVTFDLEQLEGLEPVEFETMEEMRFAYNIVKHVKSNAIVIVKDYQTVGVGAGQMNRIGAAKIALEQAGEKAQGAILASDGFFPFKDTVELAAQHGIKTIIQPGGSINDKESIDACKEYGITMCFTNRREFMH